MRFEPFHFCAIGICLFMGATVGETLVGKSGAIGDALAGVLVGTMVAVSFLGSDTAERSKHREANSFLPKNEHRTT